ncbi:MAG: UTP--glucose-1-phosphate uridylyltransferase [Tissierellia bacterium]|nr:UTP--glucose-1-phosphate uridylyltransferase [Tissierellia bacterium]
MNITKAMIPAAGLGTRFLPVTKSLPKEMLPIIDKPILQYIVDECINSGIKDIYMIIGRDKDTIIKYFSSNITKEHSVKIHFIEQKEPLGLGHAVSLGKEGIGKEPFALLLGDEIFVHSNPILKQLIDVFQIKNHSILGVTKVKREEVSAYGIVQGEKTDSFINIKSIIEKPSPQEAPSTIASIGRYILTPEIFPILETLEAGYHNEIQLTDGLQKLLEIQNITGVFIQGKRFDVGSKIGYILGTLDIAYHHEKYHDDVKNYIQKLFL